MNEGEQSVTL